MKSPRHRWLLVSLSALSLVAASCVSTPPEEAPDQERAGVDHSAWLQAFEEQYDYDVGYMEALLDASPEAFEAFLAGADMANQRAHLSAEVYHVGVLSALIADDCGACTQLGVYLALDEGIERDLLQTLLEEPATLPGSLALVHQYASQVAKGHNADLEVIRKLRAELGAPAFAELATSILGVQLYPALRRALGKEVECPPVQLPDADPE